MQFGFYPGHESGCGHPRDCPHLGGASVGHLVHVVNSSENSRLLVHRQLDAERERNSNWLPMFCVLRKLSSRLSLNSVSNDKTNSPPARSPIATMVKATAPLSKQALANAVHRLVMPVGPVKHRHNTTSVSMFRLRHAARTARRKTWQSTQASDRQNTCRKILSMAGITFRYLFTHQRDAVTVVAGFSKPERVKSSALELAHTFGRWRFIFATKLASLIEKYHVPSRICLS